MHAAALLSAMVTHGLIMPPVERYRMDEQVNADRSRSVIDHLRAINLGVIAVNSWGSGGDPLVNPRAIPWSEGNVFKSPLPDKLSWSEMSFRIPPRTDLLRLHIIDCGSIEKAKVVFLQLRMRRIPDYARSGKFLIKSDKQSFKWFLQYFGAERYSVRRTIMIW